MSYLDLPRLHVFGCFYTDPSTKNNDPKHYLPETKRPAPWQMPRGRHHFKLIGQGAAEAADTSDWRRGCRIMAAIDADGNAVRDSAVVGVPLASTERPCPARIVDLDVYQQSVSTIFGLEVRIGTADGPHLVGRMDPAPLNGAWFEAVQPTRGWEMQYDQGSYGGDSNALGVFQSVLRIASADWTFDDTGVMGQLKRRCLVETVAGVDHYLLAFRFVLDGYRNVEGSIDFCYGRMTGTLGPLLPGDPTETPGARWLEPRPLPKGAPWYVPRFYRAPFRVDARTNRLQVDWSGSVSRAGFAGPPADHLGTITAVAATPNGPVTLGRIRVDQVTYQTQGGISELDLTEQQVGLLAEAPLELWTDTEEIGPKRLFAEPADGLACRTQNRAIRLASEPGAAAAASVHVTRFGKPLAGVRPNLLVVPVHGNTPGATVPPDNPGDTWNAEGALDAMASDTDEQGFATIRLSANRDPGSRTVELDGQVYFVYAWMGARDPAATAEQESQISVLLWQRYAVNAAPEWADIHALMAPYAKLYDAMSDKFDLADKAAFTFYANNPGFGFFTGGQPYQIAGFPQIQSGAIPFYLSLPITDPRYMPVTRDLSPSKVQTIFHYILREQQAIVPSGGDTP
ncbi:MAG: hypothetical protein EA356_02065 [Geminicoccaceae bacterium]|nr:MAG: hypothetical protein EA356_02065 [Geminicoccaceae bacterium]